MSGFKLFECDCPHTPKGHKQTGRCVKKCKCQAGLKKAERKQ